MENLFSKIVKTIPEPTAEQQKALADTYGDPGASTETPEKLPLKDLVQRWQKNGTPEDTSAVLKRLKPTIDSAITSYAGGDTTLGIKAAKLTLQALKNYDPTFGADPTTYVFHNLKRLNRLSGQRGNIIPKSEYSAMEQNIIKRHINEFQEEHGREPSIAELADKTGLSKKKIDKLLNMRGVVNDTSTLAEETGSSVYGAKGISDEDYFEYVYASVSPLDQKIMEWASGYHKKPILSNNEIAAKLGVSAAAISQRKARIQQLLSDVRGLA